MIPRYNVFIDPGESHGYIQEDICGHWLRWVDVMDYVAYALAHGFIPPVVEIERDPQPRRDTMDDILPEDIESDEDDTPMPDDVVDVYDLIMDRHRRDPIEL